MSSGLVMELLTPGGNAMTRWLFDILGLVGEQIARSTRPGLDLRDFQGMLPVELLGDHPFRPSTNGRTSSHSVRTGSSGSAWTSSPNKVRPCRGRH